jgi:hypothetical protein
MNVLTVTLGQLVDRALDELEAPPEVGRAVVLSTPLDATINTLQLLDATTVSVTDIIEFDNELVLVLSKTTDANPTLTVVRGYYRTTPRAHATGTAGYLNVAWPRTRIASAVIRSFTRLEAFKVYFVDSQVMFPSTTIDSERLLIELPEGTRGVYSVRRGLTEMRDWRFLYMPRTDYSTGVVVALPLAVFNYDEFSVTYRRAYRWSSYPDPPDEDSTMQLTEGAQDLPSAYAAAWLISGREVSRMDIDRAEEWQSGEPARGGISAGLVRAKWQEFYRMVDEARRLEPHLERRPFVRQ